MSSQNNADLLLAGEGGGSKTVLCLLKKTGALLSTMEFSGVAAIKRGILPAEQILSEGINELCRKNGVTVSEIKFCYFSLGGPNQEEIESVLKASLPSAKIFVGREADGDLIMTCVPFFNCSAAIMAGTGTVAVGESEGKRRFAGGWGYEFDDAGSGTRIGRDALSAFLTSIDGRTEETSISEIFKPLFQGLDINSFSGRMALKQNIYTLNRKTLASYAPAVYEHFKRGDKTAKKIILRATEDIAAMTAAVAPKGKARILCLGGIFKLGKEFRDLCSADLKRLRPDCELLFRDDFDLAKGACLMALKMSGMDLDDIIFKTVLDKK